MRLSIIGNVEINFMNPVISHRIGGIEFDNLNLEKGSYKGSFISYKGSFISMVKAYGNTKLMVRNSI